MGGACEVELRRHAFTKKGDARGLGSHLSADGVAAARNVGSASGRFSSVVTSTSPRTLETAVAMGFAVDDLVEMPNPAVTGLVEFHAWRYWPDPFTVLADLARSNAAFGDYAAEQAALVRSVLHAAPGGGPVLFVGHGGWLETTVAALAPSDALASIGGSF